jgi:hypothetical protein
MYQQKNPLCCTYPLCDLSRCLVCDSGMVLPYQGLECKIKKKYIYIYKGLNVLVVVITLLKGLYAQNTNLTDNIIAENKLILTKWAERLIWIKV